MRPRPDAAENLVKRAHNSGARAASMRPRSDAAENDDVPPVAAPHLPASMRPRPNAAENATREFATTCSSSLQ